MKKISQETKLTIQVIIASILVVIGVVLLFLGFYAPPSGEIHDSILIAYGEVSTFGGSLLGVDYHYRYKTYIFNERMQGRMHGKTYEEDTADNEKYDIPDEE